MVNCCIIQYLVPVIGPALKHFNKALEYKDTLLEMQLILGCWSVGII